MPGIVSSVWYWVFYLNSVNATLFQYRYLIAECISARLWIEDLFSQSTYVRTWWVTLRNVTRNVVTYRRYHIWVLGMGHMCVTQSDIRSTQILFGVLWWWRLGTRGHRGLDTTTPNSFYHKFTNVTRATRASPAPACMTRARSWRTGARQRCACVFLVKMKHQ